MKYNLHLSSGVPCLQSKSVWIVHCTAISETKVVHTQKKYGEHTDALAEKGLMGFRLLRGRVLQPEPQTRVAGEKASPKS